MKIQMQEARIHELFTRTMEIHELINYGGYSSRPVDLFDLDPEWCEKEVAVRLFQFPASPDWHLILSSNGVAQICCEALIEDMDAPYYGEKIPEERIEEFVALKTRYPGGKLFSLGNESIDQALRRSGNLDEKLRRRLEPELTSVRDLFYGYYGDSGAYKIQFASTAEEPLEAVVRKAVEMAIADGVSEEATHETNLGAFVDEIRKLTGTELPPETRKTGFVWELPQMPKQPLYPTDMETDYVRAIVQSNGSPFTYNRSLQRLVQRLIKGAADERETLHEWVVANIAYTQERPCNIRLRSAVKTYEEKQGNCSEQALLLTTMLRLAGHTANYASTNSGIMERVSTHTIELVESHAFVAVEDDGKILLYDPTHDCKGFVANNYSIFSDEEIRAGYF